MDNEIVTVISILSVDLTCYLLPTNNNNYNNDRSQTVAIVNININKYLNSTTYTSQEQIWYGLSAGNSGVRNIRFNPGELWEENGRDWGNNYIAQKIIRCQSWSWSNKDVTASPECGVIFVLIAISNQGARVPLTFLSLLISTETYFIFSRHQKTNIWSSSNPILISLFCLDFNSLIR